MTDSRTNVEISFVPIDGVIGVNGQMYIGIAQTYFSHLSQGIHAFHWYPDVQRGEIEYKCHPLEVKKNNDIINELGEWAELVDIWEEEHTRREQEQIRLQEYYEASRDYWQELRSIRDERLLVCDWTQLPNTPLTEEKKVDWEVYRQALRNLPNNITDPKPLVNNLNHSDWPVPPT
jgi:hypothetical protein